MTSQEQETRILEHIRSELDREAENLNAKTAARLRRIRQAALEHDMPVYQRLWKTFRLPAMAAAAAAIVAVMATIHFQDATLLDEKLAVADMEMMSTGDQLDLFDDLDFYYWLAETKNNTG
jgi:regulator of protease activity HflC (stomatin/prohibitin superfamily)